MLDHRDQPGKILADGLMHESISKEVKGSIYLLYLRLLVLIQSFETSWAYYSQSNGNLYDSEAREIAVDLVDTLYKVSEYDEDIRSELEKAVINKKVAVDIVKSLKEWARGDWLTPFENFFTSRVQLFGLFSGLKMRLHIRLSIPFTPNIMMSSQEIEHSEDVIKWKGHLPEIILNSRKFSTSDVIEKGSKHKSIVVVGDIRNSQILMNIINNKESFVEMMKSFIIESKKIIYDNCGLFDKFTGDGFIAYFNEYICSMVGLDYIDLFLSFAKQINEFSKDLFRPLKGSISKKKNIGLLIGADYGYIDFHYIDNHLTAVGDTVVWAHRLSGTNHINEVIANEPLFKKLKKAKGVSFLANRGGITKHGLIYNAKSIDISSLMPIDIKPKLMEKEHFNSFFKRIDQ